MSPLFWKECDMRRRSEVLVTEFLRDALAGDDVGVPKLDLMARTAGLLGERQSITHIKAFKRAKKSLGIRSRRAGFGARSQWLWQLPRQSDPALIKTEAAQKRRGPIPIDWVQGVAYLDPDRPPNDVPRHRWRQFVGDCKSFLSSPEKWAERGAGLGWDAMALFGLSEIAHIVKLATSPSNASKPRWGALHDLARRRFVLIARPVAIGSADPPIHAPAATASTFAGEQILEGGPQVGREPTGSGVQAACLRIMSPSNHLARERHSQARLTTTFVSPEKPSSRAAAGVTSIIRPRTKGPRSVIVTATERPFFLFVTSTLVPNGRVRCAAVKAFGFNLSPLAVRLPLWAE